MVDETADDVAPATPEADRPTLTIGRVVVLVLACAFLGGAAGYLLGVRTTGPPDGAIDTGFLQDMIVHHEQAVSMASVASASASDDYVAHMAREVLIEQRYEIGLMDGYLYARGEGRGDANRSAMEWMGHATALDEMPGLATPAQLRALGDAGPDETNTMFLELMIAHHRAGVDMAEFAARSAEDPAVRQLGEVMARVQRQEIREYELKPGDLGSL